MTDGRALLGVPIHASLDGQIERIDQTAIHIRVEPGPQKTPAAPNTPPTSR